MSDESILSAISHRYKVVRSIVEDYEPGKIFTRQTVNIECKARGELVSAGSITAHLRQCAHEGIVDQLSGRTYRKNGVGR